jgi:plastocyanin
VQFFTVDRPGRAVLFVTSFNPAFDGTALTGGSRPVQWDFGDGTRGTSGERVTHTFAEPGTYRVTATVTDGSGRSRSWAQQVRVG